MNQELEKLKEEVARLIEKIDKLENKKYIPTPGEWVILGNGEVVKRCDTEDLRKRINVGRVYESEAIAKKAREKMIIHDIILKYVFDKHPGYDPDWSDDEEGKYFVYFDHVDDTFCAGFDDEIEDVGKVYMPEHIADELADDLNNDRIIIS